MKNLIKLMSICILLISSSCKEDEKWSGNESGISKTKMSTETLLINTDGNGNIISYSKTVCGNTIMLNGSDSIITAPDKKMAIRVFNRRFSIIPESCITYKNNTIMYEIYDIGKYNSTYPEIEIPKTEYHKIGPQALMLYQVMILFQKDNLNFKKKNIQWHGNSSSSQTSI